MQLSPENYEYFAGCDDLVNQILDKVREEAMLEAEDEQSGLLFTRSIF